MAREMRRLHDSLQRGGRVGAIDHLVRVFDDFWFRGMLVDRMQARVSARVGRDSVLAETTSYSRWLPWRQRVTIRFSVEVSKAVLRERHVKEGKPRPNVHEYQQFVSGVLVHEMAHAVIAVYACQCAECNEEFKEVDGPDGHGAGWMKLQQAIERSAEEYRLPILDFRCAEELYWAEMMGWK
ncbi:MAG: hypothetical protein M1824_003279 [Vezdaea acicularis]|nr:MAG: hypothetical protein M1824_003279 [Vezdaea acicularis]